MTIAELKKDIADLPDDGIVKIYISDGPAWIVDIHTDNKNYCIQIGVEK